MTLLIISEHAWVRKLLFPRIEIRVPLTLKINVKIVFFDFCYSNCLLAQLFSSFDPSCWKTMNDLIFQIGRKMKRKKVGKKINQTFLFMWFALIISEHAWVRKLLFPRIEIRAPKLLKNHVKIVFFNSFNLFSLVTQPMLQSRPNRTELRSMDSYIQILCRYLKCKQKAPPVLKNHPKPLSD